MNNIIEQTFDLITILQNNYITKISNKSLENVKEIMQHIEVIKDINVDFPQKVFDTIKKHRLYFQDHYTTITSIAKDKFNHSDFMLNVKMLTAGNNSLTHKKISKINKVINVTMMLNADINIYIKFYYINTYDPVFFKNILGRVYSMLMSKIESEEGSYLNFIRDMEINFVSYYNPRSINGEYKESVDEMKTVIAESGYFNSANGFMAVKYMHPSISYITRENDMLGLTVHEMGHITSCDGRIFKKDKCINVKVNLNNLIKKLNISAKDGGLDTEYTEGLNSTNSSILHSLFNAIEFNIIKNNKYDTYALFKQFIIIEIVYALQHMVRLLRWYRFKSIDEFIGQDNKIYKQNGLMFEYIFMRAYTLLNYDKYMNIIYKDGNVFDPYKNNPGIKQQKVINDITKHITEGTYNSIFNIIFNIHNKKIEKEKGKEKGKEKSKYIMDYYGVDLHQTGTTQDNNMIGGTNYYNKYIKYKKKYKRLCNKIKR